MTAEYTKTREQFDRPIATFQAVGQRAADAYIDTEGVRLTAWQAIWRLSEDLPATTEVAVAKFWAAEGGQRVVHAAQHLHGGMGVDRDYPLHRYFLWAKWLELSLGGATPPAAHDRQAPRRRAGRGLIAPAASLISTRALEQRGRGTWSPSSSSSSTTGLRIAVLDWGGDGEPLLLLHPDRVLRRVLRPARRPPARPLPPDRRRRCAVTAARDTPTTPEGFAFDADRRRRGRGARRARHRPLRRARRVARWRCRRARRRGAPGVDPAPDALRGDRVRRRRGSAGARPASRER